MEQRLSVVTLGVADLGRARWFYEGGLGWTASPASQEGVVFFQAGGLVLALYPRAKLAADSGVADGPTGAFGGITLAYNVRSRAEVAEVLAAALRGGALQLKAPHDVFWGGHCACFADPDGHVWEIAWNPFWTVAEDGAIRLPA